MGFRFRRSIGLIPGVRLNLSGSGMSVSLGTRGLRYTIGRRGTRTTVGIPGSGLSWTQYSPYQPADAKSRPTFEFKNFSSPANDKVIPVVSAPAETINRQSISDLTPSLNLVQKRFRFAPFAFSVSAIAALIALTVDNGTLKIIAFLYAAIFTIGAAVFDYYRRSIRIELKFEGVAKTISDTLENTFADIKNSDRVWSVTSKQKVFDWKRNAGASSLNTRTKINLAMSRPRCLRGSAKFPCFKTESQQLYFLPDSLLLVTRGSVAALAYQELDYTNHPIRFIEQEGVPKDSIVVDQTWRYVNKNGRPDRRFNFNRQIPICQYGEMHFSSNTGLNCIIQYSDVMGADRFSKAIEILQRPSSRIESKPITAGHVTSAWPGRIFLLAMTAVGIPILFAATSIQNEKPKALQSYVPATNPPALPPISRPNTTVTNEGYKASGQTTRRQQPRNPVEVILRQPRTMSQCLSIQDTDLRTDCLEEVHADMMAQPRY